LFESIQHSQRRARRAIRHTVDMPCEVISPRDDEPQLLWATDMSAHGAWLETLGPLDLGEQLVLCFRPGVWWRAREIQVFAEVARTSPGLRVGDDLPGVGLDFLDLTQRERWALRCWLRPRPEPEPHRRGRPKKALPVPVAYRYGRWTC